MNCKERLACERLSVDWKLRFSEEMRDTWLKFLALSCRRGGLAAAQESLKHIVRKVGDTMSKDSDNRAGQGSPPNMRVVDA